jgi:hypothetical protein
MNRPFCRWDFWVASCGLYLQGLSLSPAVVRSSCYQRADDQDWQQTQDGCPNDEGRNNKDILKDILSPKDRAGDRILGKMNRVHCITRRPVVVQAAPFSREIRKSPGIILAGLRGTSSLVSQCPCGLDQLPAGRSVVSSPPGIDGSLSLVPEFSGLQWSRVCADA